MILNLKNKDTGQWESVPALVGPPGETPYIGANGHWWIGETDTGVPARGEGSGDMLVSTYDADGSVAAAGGIKQYVAAHGGSSEGGSTDLAGYAKETWVAENYQPKGEYLTEVPEGYAKTADIPTSLSQLSPDTNNQRVSADEKLFWNGKSDFSGSYSDLTDVPVAFPPYSHQHSPSQIHTGTFGGEVVANAAGQTPGNMAIRNSKMVLTEEDPTVDGEIVWKLG